MNKRSSFQTFVHVLAKISERLSLPSASPTTGVVTYEDPCLALPGFSWSNGLCVRLYLTFYDPTNDTCAAHGAHLFDMFGEQDSESLDKLFSSFSGEGSSCKPNPWLVIWLQRNYVIQAIRESSKIVNTPSKYVEFSLFSSSFSQSPSPQQHFH